MRLIYFTSENGNTIAVVAAHIVALVQKRTPTDTPTCVYLTHGDPFHVRNSFDDCQQKLLAAVSENELDTLKAHHALCTEGFKNLYDTLKAERDALETHNVMLRAALRGVIKVADRKTDEFDAAKAALGDAK